jgi:hypothetical protein
VWRRVLTKAQLPAFRLYDLHHIFATTLLAQGAPITYAAAQMGHTKPTTTLQWYAHWLPRGDKAFVDRLDGPAEPGHHFGTVRPIARGHQVGSDSEVSEQPEENLEPTIGLEPMTCRLRIVAGAQPRTTLAV